MPTNLGAPLFKYLRREHATRLLAEGILRVGTLHEYRDVGRYGNRVGDSKEGSKGTMLKVDRLDVMSKDDLPEFVRNSFEVGSGKFTFINSTFLVTEDSPDFYIYSVTKRFSAEAMRNLGYDACVRIDDPASFFRALSHSLRHKGSFQGLHSCIYMPRYTPPDKQHNIHPALIKEPEYEGQQEQRAIWQPASSKPRPVILACRKARNYCSRVD
ncbi:hypothetical protein [Methyloglobulus sp.]|uniref:hypothetical protein n=1 Tax=Methyloglobulus sp. TaxID=2518622 RepID=UPI0032B8478D